MLQEAGIGAMLYYPVPLHLQKVHAHLGWTKGMLPNTEKDTECVISLTLEEQKTVASTLIECIEKSKALAQIGKIRYYKGVHFKKCTPLIHMKRKIYEQYCYLFNKANA